MHLRGAHGLLRKRLSSNVRASTFLLKTIQPLVYHEVISSTINSRLLTSGISPLYIDQVSQFCATHADRDVSSVTYLGVSATCLSVLLKLICLRDEILDDNVSFTTVVEAIDSNEVLRQLAATPAEGIAQTIDVLHVYACIFYRQMLLEFVGLTFDQYDDKPFSEQDDEAFQMALSSVCSYQLPPHVATWPLLVTGLVVQTTTAKTQIRDCVQRLVYDSRLASAQGVLDTLDRAWATGSGLSVLLSNNLDKILIF